jgi:membrane associated rhomboid family serine protease
LLDLRGGAKSKTKPRTATGKKKVGAAQKEDKAPMSDSMALFKRIPLLTRSYLALVFAVTFLGSIILGDELTQEIFGMDPMRVINGLQLWRPLSAAAFLGPMSLGWVFDGYHLYEYGSTMERAYGTSQHFIFLLSQAVLLSIFSSLIGLPFFATGVIAAMLHVLSRATPHQKVKWVVLTVPHWLLPYGFMTSDVLQSQNPMAAIPHILGILSGHFYHFHKFVWPKVGGEDWLVPPMFLRRLLEPDVVRAEATTTASKVLKNRKRKSGRKLGSS